MGWLKEGMKIERTSSAIAVLGCASSEGSGTVQSCGDGRTIWVEWPNGQPRSHATRDYWEKWYQEVGSPPVDTDEFITKDSGSRRSFDTGSVRDAAVGKGRFELMSPIALFRDAKAYERGAIKYEVRNWEKGQPLSVFMDCAMRHLQKHLMGYRDEDHLAAARWNIAAIMHVEHQIERGNLPAELDDLPNYVTDDERKNG